MQVSLNGFRQIYFDVGWLDWAIVTVYDWGCRDAANELLQPRSEYCRAQRVSRRKYGTPEHVWPPLTYSDLETRALQQ